MNYYAVSALVTSETETEFLSNVCVGLYPAGSYGEALGIAYLSAEERFPGYQIQLKGLDVPLSKAQDE